VFAILNVIKPCSYSYTRTLLFWYPVVALILTRSANLAFGPKSGFKNKCQARARFGLQNDAFLQLCVTLNQPFWRYATDRQNLFKKSYRSTD